MIFLVLAVVSIFIGITFHNAEAGNCETVKDRTLSYSPGHYLTVMEPQNMKPGFDPFGYNYQAHLFNGYYANSYLGKDGYPPYEGDVDAYYQRLLAELIFPNMEELQKKFEGYLDETVDPPVEVPGLWYWPYRDVILNMKWNDIWLSNKDCDGDGKLDRGYPCNPENATSSACEGAWVTNHQSEAYEVDGKKCQWNYFVKIVMAPGDATKNAGVWYAADGTEIGPVIWGAFAVIQRVYNEPCGDIHGIEYLSPAGPGFGHIK